MKTDIICPSCEHDMFHLRLVTEMEEHKVWSFRCEECGEHLLIKTLIKRAKDALQTD